MLEVNTYAILWVTIPMIIGSLIVMYALLKAARKRTIAERINTIHGIVKGARCEFVFGSHVYTGEVIKCNKFRQEAQIKFKDEHFERNLTIHYNNIIKTY